MANVTAAITEGQKIATAYSDKSQAFVFRFQCIVICQQQQ